MTPTEKTLVDLTMMNTKLTHIVQKTLFKLVEALLTTDTPKIKEIAQAAISDMKDFEVEYNKFKEATKKAKVDAPAASTGDLPGFYL